MRERSDPNLLTVDRRGCPRKLTTTTKRKAQNATAEKESCAKHIVVVVVDTGGRTGKCTMAVNN
jgi:hypothetical protein